MPNRALADLDGTDEDTGSGSYDHLPTPPPPMSPPSGSSFFLASLFGLDEWTLTHTLIASGSTLGLVLLLCAFVVLCRRYSRLKATRPATAAGWSRQANESIKGHQHANHASRAQPSSSSPDSKQFFGAPLHDATLATAPGGWLVPEPLLQLWVALLAKRDDGIEMKGVFRIAPDFEELGEVKAALQAQESPARVLGHASGPCVSSLIKSWLGSLPGDVWEAVRDDLNAQIASGDMSNVQPAELVTRLPAREYAIVGWACDMMVKVASHEAVNSMSVKAISVVIAPTLMKAPQDMDNETLMNYMTNAPSWLAKLVNDCIAAAPAHLLEPPRVTGIAKLRERIRAVSHHSAVFSRFSALSRQGDSHSELASHRSMPTSSGKHSLRPSKDQSLSFSSAVSRAAKSFSHRRASDSGRKPSLHGKRGSVTPVEAPGDLPPVVEGSSSKLLGSSRLLGTASKDSSAVLPRDASESKPSEDPRGSPRVTFEAGGPASPAPALANVVSSGIDSRSNMNQGAEEKRFPSQMSLWSDSCEDSRPSECSSRKSASGRCGSTCSYSSQPEASDVDDEGQGGTDDNLDDRRRARKLSLRAADGFGSGRINVDGVVEASKARRPVERPPKRSVVMKLKKSRMHSGLGIGLVDSASALSLKDKDSCSSGLAQGIDEIPSIPPAAAEESKADDPASIDDDVVAHI